MEIENRRRTYFIKKRFQMNFIIKFCLLMIIGSVISGACVYLLSRSTVTTSFENCRLTIKSTADFILPAVLLSGAIMIVLIGVAAVAVTLFTSHRIAGPLYRLAQDIQEVSSGNLKKRFQLRRADEIKALAENLNKMTQALRSDMAEVKASIFELESSLKAQGNLLPEVQENLEKAKKTLAKFDT